VSASGAEQGQILAVLDTCAMLPPRLSDVLFDLALEKVYAPYWTKDIEADFLRNWANVIAKSTRAGKCSLNPEGAMRRLKCFRSAIPGYEVMGYERWLQKVPSKVDDKDRHVFAAAMALSHYREGNDRILIVSQNASHLAADEAAILNIEVMKPGQFIDHLQSLNPDGLFRAMTQVIKCLEKPPYTRSELVATLRLHGAKVTADALAVKWNIQAEVVKQKSAKKINKRSITNSG